MSEVDLVGEARAFTLTKALAVKPAEAGPSLLEALKDPGNPSLQGLIAGYDTIDPQAPTGMGNILVDWFNLKLMGIPEYDQNGNLQSTNGGVFNTINGSIAQLYTSPASSTIYIADISKNIGIAPAHALGLNDYPGGFTVFQPVLKIWKIFRNIAYLVFIVIFVIMGFMIMFRAKLNPQTVISIQTAIPKIIIGLLGVTFSYAIAGLILDISQLGMNLVFEILLTPNLSPEIAPGIKQGFDLDMFKLLDALLFDPSTIQDNFISGSNVITTIINAISKLIKIITFDNANLFSLILSIVIVSNMFKIFFMLLTKYVQIIFGVIFSPLVFLIGTLPGQTGGAISNWFRSQLAHVLVFPATFFVFAIALLLYNSTLIIDPSVGGNICNPTAGSNSAPGCIIDTFDWTPDLLPLDSQNLAAFLVFGILMIIPNIGKSIDAALQVKEGAGSDTGEKFRGAARMIPLIGQFM